MSKNKIRLEICGVECVISSDDSEEYIRTIGAEVSRSINAMRKQNERISVDVYKRQQKNRGANPVFLCRRNCLRARIKPAHE